ncbi:uncharacterized protein N7515_000441 [Penicillium bovifimosum]|uniref:Trehalose-6-phosphate synthase n=1 Tax=Penicillium bovifimosum TaxID=126998 RepID=A0A9W9HI23_9EURO|nr:uncharacterized protein N7515_000441 [Penicillium bovifimosum]KAJ5145877.1 hypothetical protein N7515_000441 [Penicillium bovifimosum]
MASGNASSKQRVIIASNRLPLSVKENNGTYETTPSSGGLVSALRGLQAADYLWLGWPGIEVNDKSARESVNASLAKENAAAVWLDQKLATDHYNGFSNAILWPSLHYQSGVVMDDNAWEAYQRVNEIFADEVSNKAKDGDLIWVHDYHLFLLPRLLRKRLQAQNKRCPIGFSLHTPFTVDDFWRGVPVHDQLLEGVLGSDIIGFHTDEYKKNFLGACDTLLDGTRVENDQIHYDNRVVETGKFIVGIDYRKFADASGDHEVLSRIKELETLYKDKQVIIGVDRMDYTKGLPEKLDGFRIFLEEHPDMANKVVLIQIAVPSREDVKEYQDLEAQVSKLVGQISGKHATPHHSPLLYIHRSVSFAELAALYSISDACLLTSRRDGMNLVASEYVACQEARQGVLVLSEFTGAATFLKPGSLLFNPSNTHSLSDALYKALTMDKEERRRNYEELRNFVTTNTSAKWTETFLGELGRLKN